MTTIMLREKVTAWRVQSVIGGLAILLAAGCEAPEPEPPDRAIHRAAMQGDAAKVAQILKQHPQLANHRDTDRNARERTPLHEAADLATAKVLVAARADIHAKDHFAWTPLHTAANAEVAAFLIHQGADVRAKAQRQFTPLHVIEDAGAAEVLIRAGAQVDAMASDSMTPLRWQIQRGNAKVVKVLLDHGSSTRLDRRDKKTYLHFAADRQSPDSVRLLAKRGLNVNARDHIQATPLFYAVYKDRVEVAKALLELGADPNVTLSREAVLTTFRGGNVTEKRISEFTPLRLAKSDEMRAVLKQHGARQ